MPVFFFYHNLQITKFQIFERFQILRIKFQEKLYIIFSQNKKSKNLAQNKNFYPNLWFCNNLIIKYSNETFWIKIYITYYSNKSENRHPVNGTTRETGRRYSWSDHISLELRNVRLVHRVEREKKAEREKRQLIRETAWDREGESGNR